MRNFLYNIRNDREKITIQKFILFCMVFLILGAGSGIVSKLADVYSEILGNFTSGMCCWILIGTVICAFSKSPFRSAVYVFLFCAGMVAAYYLTAEIGELYYSMSFLKGWSVFTLFTPVFALFAWYARGKGKAAWTLRIGIAVVMAASVFLFPGGIFLDVLSIAAMFAVTLKKSKKDKENKNGDRS